MKLSFSTLGCPDWTIEQIAAKAREYGYDGVELRVHADGKHLSPADAPDRAGRAGALFREAGVEIAALSAYAEYGSAEPAKAAENAGLTRALIRMACAAGAGMVRVYGGAGGKDEPLDRVADRVVRALRPLAAEAREAGVRLAIETHDVWNSGADLVKIVRGVGDPGLAVCFDIHNTLHVNHEWRESYALLKPHIAYCHIKDACPTINGGSRLVMVGAGELPLRDIVRQLKRDGFAGYLNLEWEKRWCPDLEPPERVFPQYLWKMRQEWAEAGGETAERNRAANPH
jgi:sugar phosphate isomerase/epimerase